MNTNFAFNARNSSRMTPNLAEPHINKVPTDDPERLLANGDRTTIESFSVSIVKD
ncbi:MAG: hypothetical protein ACFFC7_12125 [Candidatus Hermodarchaeota archaeon]